MISVASASLAGLRDNRRSGFNGSRKEHDERRHDTVIILSQDAGFSHHEGCLLSLRRCLDPGRQRQMGRADASRDLRLLCTTAPERRGVAAAGLEVWPETVHFDARGYTPGYQR